MKLLVRAEIGAGRHSLVQRLATQTDIAIVEFPSFDDLDAPLHGLVQLATQAGGVESTSEEEPIARVVACARALANAGRAVVVLLPVPRAGRPSEADAATRGRVEQMLSALASVEDLRLAVIATRATRLRKVLTPTSELEIDAPLLGANAIDPSAVRDEFRAAASALARWMSGTQIASTPLEARLRVGLIALGERPEDVGGRLEALARKMAQQLVRFPSLAVAVKRMLLARRALPIDQVRALSAVDERWLPLLTECIGYGGPSIRVPEVTRQVLLDALRASPTELEDAHAALATYHESLDGARSLRQLGQAEAINWMEKVHHLALGGAATATKWSEQVPAGREQLWERARYLSRDLHRFEDAATVYERCISTFGEDPYSRHYLAFNRERAHGDTDEIRRGYEYAVTVEPANPWWQQRWIRFLIAHGTLSEARAAWQQAIRAIDPTGEQLRRSPWLALNLHYWVALRWIALGHLRDAREVLAEIPQDWLDQEAELRELEQVLTAAEQAVALGEAVYPASTPIADRWKRPRVLKPSRAGRKLASWAPGRVVAASLDEVTVVVAPTREDAQQLVFDADSWLRAAGDPAEDADGFIELGIYDGGEQVVRTVRDDGEGGRLDLEDQELLARVTKWSG